MAEDRIHTVNVVLRYAVTGSTSAAEKALFEQFRAGRNASLEQIHSEGQSSRLICADVNPGKCEGYTNYETSSIALWLENDRKLYETCRNSARAILASADAGQIGDLSPELIMGDYLKDYVEQKLLKIDDREEKARTDAERIFVSMAQAALDRVNWLEMGEHWIDDARENQE